MLVLLVNGLILLLSRPVAVEILALRLRMLCLRLLQLLLLLLLLLLRLLLLMGLRSGRLRR